MPSKTSQLDNKTGTIRESGLKKLVNNLLDIARTFKKSKMGMAGVLILIILTLFTVIGGAYKGEQSLHYGSGPVLAKPSWLGPLDRHKFKYTQSLMTSDFTEKKDISNTIPEIGIKGDKHINVSSQYRKEDNTFHIAFQDRGDSSFNTSTCDVVLSKTVPWKGEKRPPNGIRFVYRYSFGFSGINYTKTFDKHNVYQMSTAAYIKGTSFRKVEDMITYLKNQGLEIQPSDWNEHGVILSFPKYPLGVGSTRKGRQDIKTQRIINLFKELKNIKFSIVSSFTIKNASSSLRTNQGKASFSLHSVSLDALGYYSGPMGTLDVGSDLFSLIAQGLKNSLYLGLAVTALTLFLGIMLGIIAGWYGGIVDSAIMRLVDYLMVLPRLPLMLVLVGVFNQMAVSRVWGVMMTLSFINWAGTARVIRSQVLSVKERPFIEAAKASGAGNIPIMFRYIFPNVIGLVIYYAVTSIQMSILAAAGLSFLNMGPMWVSFGNILRKASGIMLPGFGGQASATAPPGQSGASGAFGSWWVITFPGLILFIFALALVFVGTTIQQRVQRIGGGG